MTSKFTADDRRYMQRALELAAHADGVSLPNPMVGAVIVAPDGRIIGEGYTDRYGCGHAEVQAVSAVREADRPLLPQSTIYVTLEPCSHYGKTPPCATMLVGHRLGRCVVGTIDTFAKVSGRGVEILRQGGVEVVMAPGDIAEACRRLNRKFFTAHALQRPYVMLKWAQSADGYLGRAGDGPARISSPVGRVAVHRLRATFDAILVGSSTMLADRPRLDVRLSGGKPPRPVVIDVRHRLAPADITTALEPVVIDYEGRLDDYLHQLYRQGICSLLVEGGADTLRRFTEAGLWDEARVEIGTEVFGDQGIAPAPPLYGEPVAASHTGGNLICTYRHSEEEAGGHCDVKNL